VKKNQCILIKNGSEETETFAAEIAELKKQVDETSKAVEETSTWDEFPERSDS
jgi:hypothetical protein